MNNVEVIFVSLQS